MRCELTVYILLWKHLIFVTAFYVDYNYCPILQMRKLSLALEVMCFRAIPSFHVTHELQEIKSLERGVGPEKWHLDAKMRSLCGELMK